MPRKGNTPSRKPNKRLGSKRLDPWLTKRFADQALPLARGSTISSSTLPSTQCSRQRHLGDTYSRLAGRVINRPGLALAAWRTARVPLASRVSEFVLRKLTLAQGGSPQALSLPLAGQRQRQRRGSEQATHAATDWQPAGDTNLWSQNLPASGDARRSPANEDEHLADEMVQTYPSVVEESPRLTTVDLLRLPMTMKERLGATDERSRPKGTTAELAGYTRIHPTPLITGQMAVLPQREDSDAFELSYTNRSGIPSHGTYQSEDPQERLTQLLRQHQHGDLGRLSPLQRGLLEARPHTIGDSISERRASLTRSKYQPEETRPEAKSSSVTARQVATPFMASLPTVQSSGETTVRDGHTLPDLIISQRSVVLPSKPLPDQRRSLSKRTMADEVSSGLERRTLHRMRDKSDGTVSSLLPDGEVSGSRRSGAVPHTPTRQLAVAAGQEAMERAVIRRSVSQREVLSLDTGVGSGPDRGFAEGHTEKPLAYRHPSPITGTAITPLPVIKRASRAMTMPPRQLFRTAASVPISAKREDYGFPQGHEDVPSSPSYKYAGQPALTLPVISPARSKAGSSAARSEELFRYMSDGMPQISHSRNHNGLELALARVGRAPETNTEAQAAVPERRAEKGGKKEGAPDIRVLAREVYPLIKRMIMIERDRHPTWY